MKSIIQDEKECFICRNTLGLENHHVIYGRGLRPLSDKYGLTVWLCQRHHRGDISGNKYAVHFNKVIDQKLKQIAQKAFMAKWPEKDFKAIFGKSYI